MVLGIFQKLLIEALSARFGKNLDGNEDVNEEFLSSLLADALPELVNTLDKSLESSAQAMLEERRGLCESFTHRNIARWKNGIDSLEKYIVLCTEIGEKFNKNNRAKIVEDNDFRSDLLIRQHARACHISNEILLLLKNGFADGAHARWRALHEVNVTGMFLSKHGREVAERFYYHEFVESYNSVKEYNKHKDMLSSITIDEDVLKTHKRNYDYVINRFGGDFKHHFGWAAPVFPNRTARSIGFAALEKNVGLEHMRPYYRWASENIHAGARGTINKLALAESNESILIVGQSNSGLTEPAHSTALSLMQITTILLKEYPSLDSLVLMSLLQTLYEKIGDEFSRAEECGGS